jgi:hypothetical protein
MVQRMDCAIQLSTTPTPTQVHGIAGYWELSGIALDGARIGKDETTW